MDYTHIVAALIVAVATIVAALIQRPTCGRNRSKPRQWLLIATVVSGALGILLALLGLAVQGLSVTMVAIAVGFMYRSQGQPQAEHPNRRYSDVIVPGAMIVLLAAVALSIPPSVVEPDPEGPYPPTPLQTTATGWHDVAPSVCRDGRKADYEIRTWPFPEWVKGDAGLYREIRFYSLTSAPLHLRDEH